MSVGGNLSEDLKIEILSRLPVKSLIRFRCVHATWNSLFKSSFFIANHRKNSKSKNHGFISIFIKENRYLRFMSFTGDNFDVCFNRKLPLKYHNHYLRSVDSCNGLVCVCDLSRRIFSYNPSTNEHKIIPLSNGGMVAFGFGYDSINNYYKIIKVVSWYNIKWENFSQAEVYTLGMDSSWREVELPDDSVTTASEYLDKRVYAYRGLLSVIKHVRRRDTFEIWVMEKYGVKESWSKLHVVELSPKRLKGLPRLLGIGMNGELILQVSRDIIVYDHENEEFKAIEFHDEYGISFNVVSYRESLVSPKEILM
ncbi:hypothetical protein PTKIN_Ptkin13bG0121100 [Pterospermum kingtungense]